MARGHLGSPELERLFRQQFRRAYWFQNSVAAVAGVFLYALFGIVDRLVSPEGWAGLWQIRFRVTLPVLAVIFAVQFVPSLGRRYSGLIIFLAMLLTGSSIVVMNLILPEGAENLYSYGLLLVMVFGHAFWRTHYLWPTAASALLFGFYLGMTLCFTEMPLFHVVAAAFYYVSTLLILAYSGWFFLRQERHSFLLRNELEQAATIDSLTGIANRRAFFEHLRTEWRRAWREGRPVCLLVVDLDNMKEINDTWGHARGDEALIQVAALLGRHARRAGDLAARLGGDEFVLLLVDCDGKAACELARHMVLEAEASRSGVTISVGMASRVPLAGEGYEQLMQEADQALYEAKHRGRAQAVCRIPGHRLADEREMGQVSA